MQLNIPLERIAEVQAERIKMLVHENTMLEALANHLTAQINSLRAEIEKLQLKPNGDDE